MNWDRTLSASEGGIRTRGGGTNMNAGADPIGATKPVDQPDRETLEVRQGTGPREMVSVLSVSLALAALAGMLLLAYFTLR